MDGFGDVFGGEVFGAGEVGDGAGDFEDAIVGAGAEVEIGHRELQKFERRVVENAVGFEFPAAHAGVAGDLRFLLETFLLTLARGDDAFADLRGGFAGFAAGDLAEFDGRDFDVQIDAVEQRAGDAAEIILDLAR